jgi:tRNA G10  N-methylase Trm11
MALERDQSQKDIIKRTKSLLESAECSVLSVAEGSYRVMIQQGSRLVHIPRAVQIKIRKTVETGTHLTYNPRKAKTEIRFLLRNDGRGYLGVSHISQKPFDAMPIVKGALHPRMAHMLNLFSLPTDVDVFLDPFAGFGSIVYDRARFFPSHKLIASDLNASLVSQLQARFKGKKDAQIVVADARRLDYIPDSVVTRVVTDPPWGLYDKDIDDSEDLYRDLFSELARVMKPEGIFVILSYQKKDIENAVIAVNKRDNREICIDDSVKTVINGKEAWVWRMIF